MTWMILMPSEADKVEEGCRRAKRDNSFDAELLIRATRTFDARHEIEVSDDDLARIERRSKDYRSAYSAAFKAILSAADRH